MSVAIDLLRQAARAVGRETWEPHINRAGVLEVRNKEGNGDHHSNWVNMRSAIVTFYVAFANPATVLQLIEDNAALAESNQMLRDQLKLANSKVAAMQVRRAMA